MKPGGSILFSLHRYCGYCPQFKYKIKETFGKTTHALLTAPGISRSARPVLAPLEGLKEEIVKDETRKQKLIESRGKNLGDQKYGKQMVPGYTGMPYECLQTWTCFLLKEEREKEDLLL